MGIQNSLANLAGVIAPLITGLVIDVTGEYYWAFVIAAGVAAVGILGWALVIPRVEPLDWEHVNSSPSVIGVSTP
jgi:MFS family permease